MARIALVVVPLLAVLVHLPSLGNGFTGWDDTLYVIDNPLMTSVDGLWRIWTTGEADQYYPLTFSAFWLEYRLWGTAPAGYHLVNVMLHALNALLVLLLLREMDLPDAFAAAAALLFATHPTATMTVAWIAQLKNLLSCAFVLLALLAWIRFRRGRGDRWYVAAFAAFVAGLLSKTAILGLPAALFVLDRAVLAVDWRSSLRRIAPLLVPVGLALLVTVGFEREFVENMPARELRPQIAAGALWFYGWRMLWPVGLMPMYPRWSVSISSAIGWLPVAGCVAVTLAAWFGRRRLDGRIAYGLVHFVVFLLPTLGLLDYGNLALTYVSDHYLYVPSVGALLALATAALLVAERRPAWRVPLAATAIVGAFLGAVGTVGYTPVFRDARTLWSRTLEGDPDSAVAHAGLGQFHEARGEWPRAAEHYRGVVDALPDVPRARLDLARALARSGRLDEAEARLLELRRADPGAAEPVLELARLAERRGRIERAVDLYSEGISLAPGDAPARRELGAIYLGLLRRADAEREFRAAVEIDPASARGWLGLATSLRGRQRYADAVETLREGLRAVPDDVSLLNYLARLLATCPDAGVRDGDEAVSLARRAGRRMGGLDYRVEETLAAAYAESGRWDEARQAALRAAELAREAGDARFADAATARASAYGRFEPLRETPAAAGGAPR